MKGKKPDYILLGIIASLLIVGLVALFSSSIMESQKDYGNAHAYFLHQLLFGVGGGSIAGFIAYKVHYKKWRSFALPMLLSAIILLIFVLIPSFSEVAGGARRWLALGDFSFQPSELAKLSLIIYLAAWLEARQKALRSWNEGLFPFLLILGSVGGLILLQPDVGTFGVIALFAAIMFFGSGASIVHIGAIAALGIGLLFFLAKLEPYRMARLISFFDRAQDPLGISYQINQALLAIGSGGMFGVGLWHSIQKYSSLPEPMTDSIFAVWAEETGFLGAIFLVSLFVAFGFRGFQIASHAHDRFGKLLALGITFWILSQALINIGSMVGFVPLTGIPLPFVSYGGSSMVVTLAGVGILLNISKHR
jgi:cell division protein FtsW